MKLKILSPYKLHVLIWALIAGYLLAATAPVFADEYRTIRAQLRHQTPRWYQTYRTDGNIVGCGAAALAIVFGYWKECKGKTNLLEGISLPHRQTGQRDPLLSPMMENLSNLTNSTYGIYQGHKWGRTLPENMCDAKKYALDRGYHAICSRIRGSEFNKFDHVKRMLDQDKPVIILINDPARAFTSLHYPVIEKAEKVQKKIGSKWRDRDVRYFVNMGNGGPGKWIWVREVGKNDHKHTGSFSMLLIDLDPVGQHTGSTRDANLSACQEWCRQHGNCTQCSRLPGCGPGFKAVKAFRGAGRDWYACVKRKSYTDASRSNQEECEDWCEDNANCVKCSELPGCGPGYKRLKKFGGRGKNWYGCGRR